MDAGWIIALISAAYCYWDAHERRIKRPWLWSVFGFFCNLFAIAFLHGNRWLKTGEERSGGRAWDSCRWFAISSTIAFFFSEIESLVGIAESADLTSDAAAAGTVIGATLGIGMIFFLWLCVAGGSLIFGLMLKKSKEEIGPTGPLATKI